MVHAKIGATILPYTKAILPIHHFDISCIRNFIFQLHDIGFALLVNLIDADVVRLPVENNTNKPIYISWNFCLGEVQKLTYPNINQLHLGKAGLIKQASYNKYKKA